MHRAPAHQRTPVEGQPQHRLRPVGDALHEGIDGNDQQRGGTPVPTVNQLNCSSTSSPARQRTARKTKACRTLTCPAGMGLSRVRSTLPSKLRSAMSFSVQPAPRMMMAPMRNNRANQGLGMPPPAAIWPSASPHQQGSSSSHQPIGRSSRASAAHRAGTPAARGGRPNGRARHPPPAHPDCWHPSWRRCTSDAA